MCVRAGVHIRKWKVVINNLLNQVKCVENESNLRRKAKRDFTFRSLPHNAKTKRRAAGGGKAAGATGSGGAINFSHTLGLDTRENRLKRKRVGFWSGLGGRKRPKEKQK